jgi:hypothetical protein
VAAGSRLERRVKDHWRFLRAPFARERRGFAASVGHHGALGASLAVAIVPDGVVKVTAVRRLVGKRPFFK